MAAIDILHNATTDKATLVLPSTAFSEHEATYLNYEGRAQLSFQVHRCHSDASPAWRWLAEPSVEHVNDLISQCSQKVPELSCLDDLVAGTEIISGMKVPRQSHRYSGRTAMKANLNVHEPKQAVDEESVMSFSIEDTPSMENDITDSSSTACFGS